MNIRNDEKSQDSIRPQRFANFVGNKKSIDRIVKYIAKNMVPTALLVYGATGVGKTTICRLIARALLCINRQRSEFEPCGRCKVCQESFDDNNQIREYMEIGGARMDIKWFHEVDVQCLDPNTVIYVDELQDASRQHISWLRKTIEEARATFIFSTTHPEEIEDAFRNRMKTSEFQLVRPQPIEVVEFLERDFLQRGVAFDSQK